MKIFFTGGGGFVGREIIPLLKKNGHKVIAPSSKDLNLLDSDAVDDFVQGQEFDTIIHSAIYGGRRCKKDDLNDYYNNIRMFENLFKYVKDVDRFINFDSGASLFRNDLIPDTPYGFSKYTIARSVDDAPNGTNLRIYGCFGVTEQPNRFFAVNINNYIEKKPITIIKDKFMDFMYIDDIYMMVELALEGKIKDYDCVYSTKYRLTDLAEMINNLDTYDVPIIMEDREMAPDYCGSYKNFDVEFVGLEEGIKRCYENYLR